MLISVWSEQGPIELATSPVESTTEISPLRGYATPVEMTNLSLQRYLANWWWDLLRSAGYTRPVDDHKQEPSALLGQLVVGPVEVSGLYTPRRRP